MCGIISGQSITGQGQGQWEGESESEGEVKR